jgi:hypothetical protein
MPTHLSIPNVSVTDPVDVVVDPHKYDTVAGGSGREAAQERHDGEDLEQLEANPQLASTLDVQSPDARSQSKRHNQGLVLDITSIRIPTYHLPFHTRSDAIVVLLEHYTYNLTSMSISNASPSHGF